MTTLTDTRIYAPAKLDIAAGQSCQEGFTGIDIAPTTDIRHDLNVYPWPIKDECVEEAFCSHFVEHVADLNAFMDEVHRILKPDAQIRIVHPHLRSDRAFQDPTHVRFIPEATWHYYSREWRETNKLDHYPIDCDFRVEQMLFSGFHGDWGLRSDVARNFALTHYWNVAVDLVVDLRKV